jgi:hypothetical protein
MLLILLFYYRAKMTPEILNSAILLKRKTGKWHICPFDVCLIFLFYANKNGVELKNCYFQ